MKHIMIIVTGKVQGVFFRACTRDKARSLELRGTVKNLSNGNVEIIAEGDEETLKELIEWTKAGSPAARVDDLSVDFSDELTDYKGFEQIF